MLSAGRKKGGGGGQKGFGSSLEFAALEAVEPGIAEVRRSQRTHWVGAARRSGSSWESERTVPRSVGRFVGGT